VLVVCVVRNERAMLPHFLAHYRRLGAAHFVFVDNGSDDGTRDWLLAQPDVVLYAADTDYRDSHYGVAWQQAVLAAHALGKWVVVADADELLLYRDCETRTLPAVVRELARQGHDAAQVLMLDMYPRGALRDTDFARVAPATAANWFDRTPLLRWHLGAGLYSNTSNWLSALRHRLIPHSPPNAFTAQKTALFRYRPWLRLSEGLHYAAGAMLAPEPLFFGHYKYHAGFREKVLREIERKQHFDGASEYAHYLHMVGADDATLFDADISVRLDGSGSLPVFADPAPAGLPPTGPAQ
jgi:glycosyltransferase involved in cell wall biosynthesis